MKPEKHWFMEDLVNAVDMAEFENDGRLCRNCNHWYRNLKTRELIPKCPWRNGEVPKATDFCSRWEPKEEEE